MINTDYLAGNLSIFFPPIMSFPQQFFSRFDGFSFFLGCSVHVNYNERIFFFFFCFLLLLSYSCLRLRMCIFFLLLLLSCKKRKKRKEMTQNLLIFFGCWAEKAWYVVEATAWLFHFFARFFWALLGGKKEEKKKTFVYLKRDFHYNYSLKNDKLHSYYTTSHFRTSFIHFQLHNFLIREKKKMRQSKLCEIQLLSKVDSAFIVLNH